jgi:hypothetical protein
MYYNILVNKKYIKTTEVSNMIKVTGLNIIEEMVNEEDLLRKVERDSKKDKINQLVAQGIDREIAKVMVKVFNQYEIA